MAQDIEDEFAAITRIQDRAIDEARPAMEPGASILIEAPVGAGKTRIMARNIANFAEDFRAEHGRDPFIAVYAHREGLLQQGRDELTFWAPEAKLTATVSSSIPTADNPKGGLDQSGDINFCTVQTGAAKLDEMRKPDLLYIDEVHHASDSETADFTKVIGRARELNPDVVTVGTTATPSRPDQRGLNPVFKDAKRITIGRLELEKARQINLPKTKEVTIHGDDGRTVNSFMRDKYQPNKNADPAGLAKAILAKRPDDYNHQMLEAWERDFREPFAKRGLSAGTIAFETNTKTAKAFFDEAEARGIKVALVDSAQSPEANRSALERYANGDLEMIVSVKMIDEGVNLPRTRGVIINRATTSATEYNQMTGRAQRTGRDPALRDVKPVVLDGGASTLIHGAIERQAVHADYIQRMERGEIREPIYNDSARMPEVEGAFEPWKLTRDPPPVHFLTDGTANYFAVAYPSEDGKVYYALAEAREVNKRMQVSIMRDTEGKPMINIDAPTLRKIEAQVILPAKYEVLRLEATESKALPGQSLVHERMVSAAKQADTAVDFATQFRAHGLGR
jgi:superfamily II DNA or RNA helicase